LVRIMEIITIWSSRHLTCSDCWWALSKHHLTAPCLSFLHFTSFHRDELIWNMLVWFLSPSALELHGTLSEFWMIYDSRVRSSFHSCSWYRIAFVNTEGHSASCPNAHHSDLHPPSTSWKVHKWFVEKLIKTNSDRFANWHNGIVLIIHLRCYAFEHFQSWPSETGSLFSFFALWTYIMRRGKWHCATTNHKAKYHFQTNCPRWQPIQSGISFETVDVNKATN
jgi:hypothetical protein